MLDRLALLIGLASLVIISMDLSLSVILSERKSDLWAKWNIVLCASLLGMSVFYIYDVLSIFLFDGLSRKILSIVFEIFFIADTSFIIVLLCRFVSWLIARPMSRAAVVLTFANGVVYLVISVILGFFVTDQPILYRLQPIPAVISVGYCVIISFRSYTNIENQLIRQCVKVINIVTYALIPVLLASAIFIDMRRLAFSVVELAYYIIYLTFMFISLRKSDRKPERKPPEEITVQDLAEYHITDREFEVIKLIRKGLTNKEIGFELGISVNTVNNHIANIFQKTGVRSRIDLLNVLQEATW